MKYSSLGSYLLGGNIRSRYKKRIGGRMCFMILQIPNLLLLLGCMLRLLMLVSATLIIDVGEGFLRRSVVRLLLLYRKIRLLIELRLMEM